MRSYWCMYSAIINLDFAGYIGSQLHEEGGPELC